LLKAKAKHLVELGAHLQANLYLSAKAVAYWVKEIFGVSYTESGMTAVLRRLGYVYKKPRLLVLARPTGKRKRNSSKRTTISAISRVRMIPSILWMRLIRNTIRCLPAVDQAWRGAGNPYQHRATAPQINGVIDLERLEPVVRCNDTINADSTIALFEQLVAFHPMAVCIYVICDNAPHYRTTVPKQLKTT